MIQNQVFGICMYAYKLPNFKNTNRAVSFRFNIQYFLGFTVLACMWARARYFGCHSAIHSLFLAVIQVGVPILEQQLSNIDIPDISGSASVDVIGTIDYELKK